MSYNSDDADAAKIKETFEMLFRRLGQEQHYDTIFFQICLVPLEVLDCSVDIK